MSKYAYNMTSDPSSYCVIINMINFDGNIKDERNTWIESVNLMRKTFEYVNFKAII